MVPGFGALADRQVVYLRLTDDDGDLSTYLTEAGPDGRRIRQVEVAEDGAGIKTDVANWPLNPPVVDLFDPQLPGLEIGHDEFERAWAEATWQDSR